MLRMCPNPRNRNKLFVRCNIILRVRNPQKNTPTISTTTTWNTQRIHTTQTTSQNITIIHRNCTIAIPNVIPPPVAHPTRAPHRIARAHAPSLIHHARFLPKLPIRRSIARLRRRAGARTARAHPESASRSAVPGFPRPGPRKRIRGRRTYTYIDRERNRSMSCQVRRPRIALSMFGV